jgi:hypothetical protein
MEKNRNDEYERLRKILKEYGCTTQEIEEDIARHRKIDEEHDAWVSKLDKHFVELWNEGKEDLSIPLARLIEEQGKLSLNILVEKSGLARQTVFSLLKRLVRDEILNREIVIRGRGRPTILFYRTEKPIRMRKLDTASLPFGKLKNVCRYQKNQWCQQKDTFCSIDKCPIILK